jgi:hypothetical protein
MQSLKQQIDRADAQTKQRWVDVCLSCTHACASNTNRLLSIGYCFGAVIGQARGIVVEEYQAVKDITTELAQFKVPVKPTQCTLLLWLYRALGSTD